MDSPDKPNPLEALEVKRIQSEIDKNVAETNKLDTEALDIKKRGGAYAKVIQWSVSTIIAAATLFAFYVSLWRPLDQEQKKLGETQLMNLKDTLIRRGDSLKKRGDSIETVAVQVSLEKATLEKEKSVLSANIKGLSNALNDTTRKRDSLIGYYQAKLSFMEKRTVQNISAVIYDTLINTVLLYDSLRYEFIKHEPRTLERSDYYYIEQYRLRGKFKALYMQIFKKPRELSGFYKNE